MPWFKVSDDWATHPKVISAGKNARLLWFTTGNLMAKAATDGLIPADQHRLYASLAEVPWKASAAKLIEVGLWHDAEGVKKCRDCQIDLDNINRHRREHDLAPITVGPKDLYWHAWAAHQLSKTRQMSPEAKAAEDRSRALKRDTELCREIQRRDQSLCRFCGVRVDWRDRRGRHRATYDHLDPFCYTPNGGNYLEGVVTACGKCNGDKGQRTAEEWEAAGGPALKPPGWQPDHAPKSAERSVKSTAENAAQNGAESAHENEREIAPISERADSEVPGHSPDGSNPDLTHDLAGSDPTHARAPARARLGTGQVRLGPGLGPDQVRPGLGGLGLGGVGAGPDLAGLVRSGSGAPPGATPDAATDVSDGSTSHATDGGQP